MIPSETSFHPIMVSTCLFFSLPSSKDDITHHRCCEKKLSKWFKLKVCIVDKKKLSRLQDAHLQTILAYVQLKKKGSVQTNNSNENIYIVGPVQDADQKTN
jgi:hypothetical protein